MKKTEKSLRELYRLPDYQDIRIREDGSIEIVTVNNEPSLTDSTNMHEHDVNYIMSRYMKTGEFPVSLKQGSYLEVPSEDLFESINLVNEANAAFNALDARIRARFDNDPVKLLAAVEDPSQHQLLKELGVLNKASNDDSVAVNDDNKPKPTSVPKSDS